MDGSLGRRDISIDTSLGVCTRPLETHERGGCCRPCIQISVSSAGTVKRVAVYTGPRVWAFYLRPTIMGSKNKNRISPHFGRLFVRGREKMSLAPSLSYRLTFEGNLVALADFACSNSNGWATDPVSIKISNLGQLDIRWNFEPAKSANSTRFLSKRLSEFEPVGYPVEL